MAGRRVRCPECDSLVEVIPLPDNGPGADGGLELEPLAVELIPSSEPSSGDTVMLEAVPRLQPLPPEPAPRPQFTGPPRKPPAPPKPAEDEPPKLKKLPPLETEMDMTPMIDATFQLLIFFMITAAFALQKSKEIPKPKSDEPSTNVVQQDEETANAVVVRIDEYNSYLVINADGDEEEAPSVVDLHIKLRKAHEGDSEGRIPTKLRVEVHDEAFHDRVITAIDAGNDVGFAEVELASIGEEEA
jgi:biopolymer transport protein ExbD